MFGAAKSPLWERNTEQAVGAERVVLLDCKQSKRSNTGTPKDKLEYLIDPHSIAWDIS